MPRNDKEKPWCAGGLSFPNRMRKTNSNEAGERVESLNN
ncbi:hypothetical protein C943_01300 [Mariniradius saccharolyticus AK6]|uniref:Uncharacterized protein n=1 Tax=Mariniradius saccharolyticus AK6 TaxID=1239962 RepID=M7XDA8_9BACT|nr:hypothetical protein C943_01300 [Mariniradius saccharolyticus AK6]